jgi:hypothetical protein
VRDFIDGLLYPSGTTRTVWEATTAQQWHKNLLLVNAGVLCPTELDATSIFDAVVTAWTNPPHRNRIEIGSWVKRINSFEDEGLPDQVLATANKS